MHLSVRQSQALDAADDPIDPDQSPADILILSFTDSDLACMAAAYKDSPAPQPSLRLSSLARLKHPLSVDLYVEQLAAQARVILVRLLGGPDWWRYGCDEFCRIAREKNISLIMVPGDGVPDPLVTQMSNIDPALVAAIDVCLRHGGVENARRVLDCLRQLASGEAVTAPQAHIMAKGALYRATAGTSGAATIIFYRAHYFAADTAPIDALLEALEARGLAARAFMVTSLKDPAALTALHADIEARPADIILDATAFSAGEDGHPLAISGAPILQCALANTQLTVWQGEQRGLTAADLAMHVVLPEADGRVFSRAISFKTETGRDDLTQSKYIKHTPVADRVDFVADLAANWVKLAKKPAADRRLALILSDYPDRAGRSAYAVGLDGPQSATRILGLLQQHDYQVSDIAEAGTELLQALQSPGGAARYSFTDYHTRLAQLPQAQQTALYEAWGAAEDDPLFKDGAFHLPCVQCGNVTIALQPDRGSALDRKSGYHDAVTPPRHGYLAFYWWLCDGPAIDAMVHLGTHGNLEWLPGKSVALSSACWPEIVVGPVPVIYPYIVSDPGEAAQAKRRIAAVTLSHLTPPLMPVSLSPDLASLEMLIDEYSGADGLDGRRMKLLKAEILDRARRAGLPGASPDNDEETVMVALETHLCDIKEQRVGNGLHVFGQTPPADSLETMTDVLFEISGGQANRQDISTRLRDAGASEEKNLLRALAGKFVMPGPGGSPVRGRLDILPTGRNMVTMDPRAIPTRTAVIIGNRAADEFVRRFVQDHGDWPRSLVMDVWGSATLRNGGDEIAQALCLMGVAPIWDAATHRVCGFDILPAAEMSWPRIDISLRISGLFRDMFGNLITLFDDAVQAVAQLDESAALNPLAAVARGLEGTALRQATWRIFGSAPGAYGAGINDLIDSGRWTDKGDLGQAYLDASQFAYGRNAHGELQPAALQNRIRAADALIHVQDQREMDVLSGADFADAEGGFAAAAALLGGDPSLYQLDTSRPGRVKVRTLAEEISLILQARALNAEWIAGQMNHSYAGAAAFADVVDQLFAFAATTNQVSPAQFDGLFDAYLHDDAVRDFIARKNPDALRAIADRLNEAIRRGLWTPLRNSVWTTLADLRASEKARSA